MSSTTAILTVLAINSFTSWAFEVPHPKFIESPTTIVRQLYPEAQTCYQMTWDLNFDSRKPRHCRSGACFSPIFTGPVSPGPEDEAFKAFKACKLSKGESCIKMVIYNKADKPTYVTRYCGVVKSSVSLLAKKCRKINNVEVCSCRERDGCNAAAGLKGGLSFLASLLVILFSKLL